MGTSFESLFLILEVVIFFSVILMHVMKKNRDLVILYVFQSIAVSGLLGIDGITRGSWELSAVALIVFLVKVIFAPYFFYRFVNKSRLNIMTSTYLNVPFTLTILLAIIFFSQSDFIRPLTGMISREASLSTMLISSIFMSIFLLINRKGSLSQIIGILSVENTIVSLGFFLGLTQTFAVEVGILFNVLLWVVLATIFLELIYRKLGTTDVTELNKLQK